jgi:hypothetical protein
MMKGNHEDAMTGVCLKSFGAFPKDTRDPFGREHFLAIPPSGGKQTLFLDIYTL